MVEVGDRAAGECWAGVYVRQRGIPVLELFRIKPSVTVGLSLVNRPIGLERDREKGRGGDARVLFLLAPEVAVSPGTEFPWELVSRLHHRSGFNETLGGMGEGHNAVTLGLRRRF